MRVLLQRSLHSFVEVNDIRIGEIERGLVLLSAFTYGDSEKDIDYIVDKLLNLRIFDDEKGVMNKSLLETAGAILSISQFTLYADTRKGRRPSYNQALPGIEAETLYNLFNQKLKEKNVIVETGAFGQNMKISITNDGPVTILLNSKN